jgi:hypothetical protein
LVEVEVVDGVVGEGGMERRRAEGDEGGDMGIKPKADTIFIMSEVSKFKATKGGTIPRRCDWGWVERGGG